MTDTVARSGRSFQLSLPGFEGEIGGLLSAVADGKVALDEVPLASITAQFASFLAAEERIDLVTAGEVLTGAARLLQMKSSRLLAQPAAEEAVEDVETPMATDWPRLLAAAAKLRVAEGRESLVPLAPPAIDRRFEPRQPSILLRAWQDAVSRCSSAVAPVAVPGFVRLEVAVSALIRRLKSSSRIPFRSVTEGASRQDVVIHFLAVLELIRRRQAAATQRDLFGDIALEYAEQAETSASRAG